ncbi:MAG: outer membrane protein assembly factor [Gammaproteobacteria bacterium]|nr:outer membrane protein assembly factor [Gammaproteobacteria bacterium]
MSNPFVESQARQRGNKPRFAFRPGRFAGSCLLLLLLSMGSAPAEETQPSATEATDEVSQEQTVRIEVTGVKDELLNNVLGFLPLYEFADKPAPSPARVRFLHQQAEGKIKASLQPFGYYKAEVRSELQQQADGWLASYAVDPGERIRVAELTIEVSGEGSDDPEFRQAIAESPLRQGEPLEHAPYEALKKQFQVLASELGYFDAKLLDNRIRINLPDYSANVVLRFETGRRYKLGEVNFSQDKPWLAESFLNKYVEIEPGQDFKATDLQQLQGDLSNTEYYKQVELNISPDQAENLVIPVNVDLQAQNPLKYIFGVGYGTDTGARAKVGVTGRRVNQYGHNYTTELLVSQIKYGVAGEYIIPGSDPRSDAYGLRASYEDEHSDNRNYKAFNIGGYYKYLDGLWMKTWALDYRVEKFELVDEEPTSKLLIPSVDWTRTYPPEMEKRIYANHGTRLQLLLRGGAEALLSDTSFLQPQVSAKWIYSFRNRTRVITRGTLGTTWVDDFDKLPTSLRYFSGGDKSLRGYEYGIIGPREDGEVVGGKHLAEVSLEYEIPISEKWSVAAFADYGDAFNDSPDYKTGAGLGLHWQSPIGPVRIDLGHGLDDPPGNQIRLHLSIGPDL